MRVAKILAVVPCVLTMLAAVPAAKGSQQAPEVGVSEISAIVSERSSGFTILSLQADVTNNTERNGDVFVTVIGRDRQGNEVDSAIIRGRVDAGGTRTLTTNAMLSDATVSRIRTWRTETARIHQ